MVRPGCDPQDTFWQKKLEDAQNVLFCKELFSQLAKEAIQLQVWSLVLIFVKIKRNILRVCQKKYLRFNEIQASMGEILINLICVT